MTIEQLLNCSASELETMTDAQLLEYFAPVLNVTRPETGKIVKLNSGGSTTSKKNSYTNSTAEAARNQDRLMKLFEQAGLKLDT